MLKELLKLFNHRIRTLQITYPLIILSITFCVLVFYFYKFEGLFKVICIIVLFKVLHI